MLIYPIFIPFKGCPYQCIYCQQESITHVKENQIEIPYEELDSFTSKNKNIQKQIAFFGGTFTAIPLDEQRQLLSSVEKYIDQFTSIRISTRPDCITNDILLFLKDHNVKTIELGIQSFDNEVLAHSKRYYDQDTAVNACKQVKEMGFDLCIQLMPGLPNDTRRTFIDSIDLCCQIKPDFVRLYPTVVLKNTRLAEDYLTGKYQLISEEQMLEMLIDAIEELNASNIQIIKIGLHSDLNPDDIVASNIPQNIGEIINGIFLFKKILREYIPNADLYVSKFDISALIGNKRYVIHYFKQKQILFPDNIIVDKSLNKNDYYFIKH